VEDIKALVNLLSLQKVKQIEIITEDAEMSPMTRQFYEGVRDGLFEDDAAASIALYGDDENNPAYRKLKYRLKQRLINTLFFIDIQEYSKTNYEKALHRSLKNWSAFKILLEKGLKVTAVDLIESVLKSSIKYDLIELNLLILKELKFQFGLYIENKYKHEKYSKLYKKYKHIYNLKELIEDQYVYLAKIIVNSKAYEYDDKIESIENQLYKLDEQIENIDSYHLKFYFFNALSFIAIIKKDNTELLKICERAIEYYTDISGFSPVALYQFYQKKGIALLSLQNYNDAEKIFNYCFSFNPREGSVSWQFNYNYLFTTQILKKDYLAAYEVLSKVVNNTGFRGLNENFRETWYLKEAFIQFLISIGKINPDDSDAEPLRGFRLSRFMNEVPVFAKDKRGLNITINILQMLFLIVEEKFDEVLDKLAALRQYNFRYLKRPEYKRSSSFIKMLLKIPEGDYKAALITKKSNKFYQELLENPSDYSEHALSLEIIPYEQLWDEIMSIFRD